MGGPGRGTVLGWHFAAGRRAGCLEHAFAFRVTVDVVHVFEM